MPTETKRKPSLVGKYVVKIEGFGEALALPNSVNGRSICLGYAFAEKTEKGVATVKLLTFPSGNVAAIPKCRLKVMTDTQIVEQITGQQKFAQFKQKLEELSIE